jgi:hypothetical protein
MTRETFEEWHAPYDLTATERMWARKAWQAATNAALDRAEKVCEAIENERWALYKGRPPYTGTEQGRADNYVQGESGGAGLCVTAIRALKDKT